MTTRVLINGAKGRMGSQAVKAVQGDIELNLVDTADHGDNLRTKILESKAEVVLDLTTASVAYQMALTIVESGARPIIGTTGLLPEQVANLREICKSRSIGGLIVPNFSISAVLMMRFAKEAAKHMPHVEIIELHHDNKEESPSGTAMRTAEMIHESRKVAASAKGDRPIIPHARGADYNGVRIHAVRLPGFVAHQEVIFGDLGQSLVIRADSFSREAFMPGVLLACKKVSQLNDLLIGLEHIL